MDCPESGGGLNDATHAEVDVRDLVLRRVLRDRVVHALILLDHLADCPLAELAGVVV